MLIESMPSCDAVRRPEVRSQSRRVDTFLVFCSTVSRKLKKNYGLVFKFRDVAHTRARSFKVRPLTAIKVRKADNVISTIYFLENLPFFVMEGKISTGEKTGCDFYPLKPFGGHHQCLERDLLRNGCPKTYLDYK